MTPRVAAFEFLLFLFNLTLIYIYTKFFFKFVLGLIAPSRIGSFVSTSSAGSSPVKKPSNMLAASRLCGNPFLIMGNKTDVEGRLSL